MKLMFSFCCFLFLFFTVSDLHAIGSNNSLSAEHQLLSNGYHGLVRHHLSSLQTDQNILISTGDREDEQTDPTSLNTLTPVQSSLASTFHIYTDQDLSLSIPQVQHKTSLCRYILHRTLRV